ncbi:MAG: spore photoproduct lyase [Gammaproteobacteria bacterium]|jgi:spore photoproduct lyase
MFKHIYIEEKVRSHPRAIKICENNPDAKIIYCDKYSEIFNKKSQNFRLQKLNPALILANKEHNFVLPAPGEFSIGGDINYYFSHMLNCLYDCRYCFLQGMYRSANYVLYVNYDDFIHEINNISTKHPDKGIHYFSGYDCDSLVFDPITEFTKYFIPAFTNLPNSLLELRTKSTQIRTLLSMTPVPNCIIAYSLNPDKIASALEHKAPSIKNRLVSLQKLQRHGWNIGLRFDPLIYDSDYKNIYSKLFKDVFQLLNIDLIHSISIGTFRLPKTYFKELSEKYPEEKLFSSPLNESQDIVQYKPSIRTNLLDYCYNELLSYAPEHKIYPCEPLV